jgi:predicted permease
MWRWRRYIAKFCNLFRHSRAERDLAREVAAHLALMEDDFLQHGMTPEEARPAARRAYGGVEQAKELHRDERSIVWLEQTVRDVRYACRNLVANPGLTLVVVITLALGISVNTTLFSAYNAVALKSLPIANSNEVFRLERWFEHGYRGDIQYAFSYPEYIYCHDHNNAFSSMAAASWPQQMLVEDEGNPNASEPGVGGSVELVSANYFASLGINPQLGRYFLPEEDGTPGANAVAVISYPFWESQFHSDQRILGRVFRVNGISFTIIGIAPEEFTGTDTLPRVPDAWVPLSMQTRLIPGSDWLHEPDNQRFLILARLKSSMTLKPAQLETDSLVHQFGTTFKSRERTIATTLQHPAFFANTEDIRFKIFVAALMLLVGSVLLVACANVANILLARGASRQREIGIRLALGASRVRIIRQLLTESILLALLGGAGGLFVSIWTTKLLWIRLQETFFGPMTGPLFLKLDLSPDVRVLAYALGLSLITGVLFGLSPALQFSRSDLTLALKNEGAAFGRCWKRSRTRSLLVAAQVAVSMTLLISAGLLLRGLVRSQTTDPGFETHRLIMLSGSFDGDPAKRMALERQLVNRLQTLPGIQSAALGTVPLLGTWTPPIFIEDARSSHAEPSGRTLASCASDTYFDTVGIPLMRGRGFSRRESASAAHVAVISQSAARRFWPNEDPLGKRFKLDLDFRGKLTEFEVIGIAKDVRFANLSRIDPAHVYVPTGMQDLYGILLRARGDPRLAITSVRSGVSEFDRKLLPGLWLMTIEKGPLHVWKSLAQISATYAGILAAVALLLAAVGIHGVMAYLVNQRTREIGVRMALGASATNVLKAIVADSLRPAFVGIAVGISGAAALSWILHRISSFPGSADFFYGVPFYDPLTFLGLVVFFIFVGGIASFVPARRAVRVDPVEALRWE